MPGIVIQITGDGAGAAEALRVIEERMQQTARRGTEMGDQIAAAGERIRSTFEMVGIGLGFREALNTFREMISQSMELGVELGHLSQQTGISVENLSVLKYVSDQTGVSFETLQKGFKKLSTELEGVQHGTKAAAQAFSDAGITPKELTATGGDLYKVMELVADKFKEMPDGYQKNAVASELFGRAGQNLIPILNQGADGIANFRAEAESLGLVLDDSGVKKMEELHRSIAEMKGAWAGLALELTSAVAPGLERVARDTSGLLAMLHTSTGETIKGLYGAALQSLFGSAGPGFDIQMEAAAKLIQMQKEQAAALDAGSKSSKSKPGPGPDTTAKDNHMAAVDMGIERFFAEMAKRDEEAINRLVAADVRLTEAGQNAQLEIVKSGGKLRLAQLDTEHKLGTITEQQYLKDKLALLTWENAAEIAVEQAKQATLRKAIAGEGPTDTVRKLELEAQLAAVDAKLAELANARLAAETQITGEIEQQGWAKQVEAAKQAIYERQQKEQQEDRIAQLQGRADAHGDGLNIDAARQASQTLGNFADQLTAQALQGKISFKSMVDSAIMDLERFAMKVLAERALIPMLNSLFGLGGNAAGVLANAQANPGLSTVTPTPSYTIPAMAGGGEISQGGMAVVGDGGDGSGAELFAPKGPGTVLPHDVLEGIAKGGGSGRGAGAPNVMINNVNNSSQPVEMKQNGVSFDADARQFIIHTVLEDAAGGGPIAGMLGGR